MKSFKKYFNEHRSSINKIETEIKNIVDEGKLNEIIINQFQNTIFQEKHGKGDLEDLDHTMIIDLHISYKNMLLDKLQSELKKAGFNSSMKDGKVLVKNLRKE